MIETREADRQKVIDKDRYEGIIKAYRKAEVKMME